ncbi:hypothetical protein [Arthrobacter sp. FW306-04-A]|uniref:hypothetical protein n=1 Tax=Arthrobacter sp. FW306-04-A TaxID=2879619 RepID=UPI0037BEF560|nr:hypothetical protein LFT43_08665 [Arthrobacter sp. FW306-04-A]
MIGKTKVSRAANEAAHAARGRAEQWIRNASGKTSPQAEAAIRWAVSRLDEAQVPDVVHGVVLTLTGNRKLANRARKAASRAVLRAERKLRPAGQPSGKTFLVSALAAAAAAVAGVLVWRMVTSRPDPKESEGEQQTPSV